jgi:hypothetical protein
MKLRFARASQCLVAAACLLMVSMAVADDSTMDIPLTQVPKAVMDAVKKKFPEAKPQSASQGKEENNQPFYDVFIHVKSQKIWVTCDSQGKILVIDREITLKDLPQPVADALHKRYPKATIRLVNEIADDGSTSYDIAVTFNKKSLIAVFAASGQFVEQLDDEE